MRFQSYFNTAIKIIQLFDGNVPLQYFLKQYFAQHKKHGSKDRKFITNICYNFFRLGKCFTNKSIEEKLKIAIFLCNNNIENWKFLYDDEWQNNHNPLLEQRIAFIQTTYSFTLHDVFSFADEVSVTLNLDAFIKSFFIQPDVFIRIRPNYFEAVANKLRQSKTDYNVIDEFAVAMRASVKIDAVINIDKEAVIQDYSSQKIKEFLGIIKSEILHSEIKVWDCCAASGGKSILAYDMLDKIHLTVSDVRASIIQNLKQRFKKAGIKKYKSFVADVARLPLSIYHSPFDVIICDAPCTGSGTWSRTPEQLYFFEYKKIKDYALLQQKIAGNAVSFLKSNGFFLYITCSVFKEENEAIVQVIQEQMHLELIKMGLLKGYDKKADTMFAALFRKNN